VIDTHSRSRKNINEREIEGSVENQKRITIKLIAIEIIRIKNGDLGSRAQKSWKGSGSG
jgi:hypothetical protein